MGAKKPNTGNGTCGGAFAPLAVNLDGSVVAGIVRELIERGLAQSPDAAADLAAERLTMAATADAAIHSRSRRAVEAIQRDFSGAYVRAAIMAAFDAGLATGKAVRL